MNAGKPYLPYWAVPAPGLKTEFEADSVGVGFTSSLSLNPPSWAPKAQTNPVAVNAGTFTLSKIGETP
jgi:hypothetical protein